MPSNGSPADTRRVIKLTHTNTPSEVIPWSEALLSEIARRNGRLSRREIHHALLSGHTVRTGAVAYCLATPTGETPADSAT